MQNVMDTISAIEERRAVKSFDPEYVMPAEDETELLRLARLAPTSFNIQNWRFVLVKDNALREQVKAAAWDQAQVTDASLVVLLCGDVKAFARQPERYWRNFSKDLQNMLVNMLTEFYQGNEQLQLDEVHRSCGLAGQTLMLAAKSLGYDSCPMVGFDAAKVGELINLPADHVVSFMVVIGKALKPAYPRSGDIPDDEAIIIDRFA